MRDLVSARQVRRLPAAVSPFQMNLVWLRQSTSQVLHNFLPVAQEVAGRGDDLLVATRTEPVDQPPSS